MKKTLLSILLVLSFKIGFADQLVCPTISEAKEVQSYLETTKNSLLWDACCDDDVAEMFTNKNIDYQKLNFKDSYQVGIKGKNEKKEYIPRDLDLVNIQNSEKGFFKSTGKILNDECYPYTETIQLVNDTKISQVQENKQTTKFIITNASTNGVDTTPTLLEAKAYLVFYTVENDNLLYMSHVWPKQNFQSYGPMYSVKNETKKETYEEYKADVFNFDWLYITGYADKKGAAKVQLIKVYKPQGITYVLKIMPPTLEVIIYKGYLEGSLNFSAFE